MQGGHVAIHLYIGSVVEVPDSDAVVTVKTDAPWDGEVEVTWRGTLSLALRIPGWAESYSVEGASGHVKDGYLYLPESSDGKLRIVFDFQPRLMYANTILGKNEICVMRGPLVYCVEDVDNDVDIDDVALSDFPVQDGPQLKILGHEVTTVVARGRELKNVDNSKLYNSKPWGRGDKMDLTFIPYYARANRGGRGGMRVWCFRD